MFAGAQFAPLGQIALDEKIEECPDRCDGSEAAYVVPGGSDRSFDDIGCELKGQARGEFAETAGEWFDPLKGVLAAEKGKGVGSASRFRRVHPFATKDLAKLGGEAAVREEARQSVSGHFEMAGNPTATAEAPVRPVGYGAEIDGLDIVAVSVTNEVTFGDGGGWITTVEVESSGEKAAA